MPLLPGHIVYRQNNSLFKRIRCSNPCLGKLLGTLKVFNWKLQPDLRCTVIFVVSFSASQCSLGCCCFKLEPQDSCIAESSIETRSLKWLLCQTFSQLSMATGMRTTVTDLAFKNKIGCAVFYESFLTQTLL